MDQQCKGIDELPLELTNLLLEFSAAVLNQKPNNISDFAADYFCSKRNKPKTEDEHSVTENLDESDIKSESIDIKKVLSCRFGRRFSVSSESYDPENGNVEESVAIFPKTKEQVDSIRKSLKNVFLFRVLDKNQLKRVIEVMTPKAVDAGEIVIKQGDDGDYFYIIEEGIYNVFTEESGESQPVMIYDGSGSFGELALMYNVPRAATVKAVTDGFLWLLNRQTFRRLVLQSSYEKRQRYHELISKVPALDLLTDYEKLNLCDALVPVNLNSGDNIIYEGEIADGMYFIEEGVVRIVYKDKGSPKEETEVAQLVAGDYFGEMALVTKKPRCASVSAVSNVQLAFLDADAFQRLLGPCMDVMKRKMEKYSKPPFKLKV